jgi:hypothetical protein
MAQRRALLRLHRGHTRDLNALVAWLREAAEMLQVRRITLEKHLFLQTCRKLPCLSSPNHPPMLNRLRHLSI